MKTFLRFLIAWVIYVGIALVIFLVSSYAFPASDAPQKAWGMAFWFSFPAAWKFSKRKKPEGENSEIA